MRGLDIPRDEALVSMLRAAWPWIALLAAVDLGPLAAAPLGLFYVDTATPWFVPVGVALACGRFVATGGNIVGVTKALFAGLRRNDEDPILDVQ